MAKATSMAELMAKSSPSIKSLKKGEKVNGKITKLHKNEILVDIGAKTEAVVLEKEKSNVDAILATLKVGDTIEVGVLNPESDQGHPVVSLRHFMDEKIWGNLENIKNDKKVLEVSINNTTKGGFLVTTNEGQSGFLPNSQVILNDTPSSFVGKKLKVIILEINRSLHKIIFSQKAATSDDDFSKAVKGIKVGDIIDTVVSNTTTFGIFVKVENTEGFIHLSELSWERQESADSLYKVGDKLKAKIIGIDKDGKRVNLSIKKLTEDPFEESVKDLKIDKKVNGRVRQIISIGVIVDLDGIDGLIKKDKIPPSTKYNVGDNVEAVVSDVDLKRHRIIIAPVLKEKPMGYR